MKKLLLSIFAATAVSAASFAEVSLLDVPNPGVRHNGSFDFVPAMANSTATDAPRFLAEASANSLDFSLAFQPYTALRFNQLPLGTEIYQAFEFSDANRTKYDGMTITSVNITTGAYGNTQSNGVKNVTVFLTEDIDKTPFYTQDATLSALAYDLCKIELNTPYTISKDKPFFIGYTCKPTSQQDYYIVVDGLPTNNPDGGYIGYKSGNSVLWDNLSSSYGNLCIGATIKGDNLPQNGVSLYRLITPTYTEPGKGFNIDAYVVGTAANEAREITVEYTIGSQPAKTVPIQFNTPLGYNSIQGFRISGAVCTETGVEVPVKLTVKQVNGSGNSSDDNVGTSTIACFEASKGFSRKSVIEEGTGNWCGWCPAGIVLMEYVRDTYPDDFIRLALHCRYSDRILDPMEASSASSVLNYFEGFPSMLIDRSVSVSPTSQNIKTYIDEYYNEMKTIPAIVEVSDISVEKNSENNISIASSVKFAFDITNDNRYRMAYYLSEDGVGPYNQTNNYYGGSSGEMGGWESKKSPVSTIYDDVVRLLLGRNTGFSGSIPTEIKANENYSYTTTASTESITGDKYFVTALVIDNKTGEIANARQIEVNKSNGITSAELDNDTPAVKGATGCIIFERQYASATVYNISGAVVAMTGNENSIALPAGVYIVKTDDTVTKVIVR